ncbi:UNVERIFIED_CONTAM: hypothetical protein FKN15_004933 [Acipenser sinensis]
MRRVIAGEAAMLHNSQSCILHHHVKLGPSDCRRTHGCNLNPTRLLMKQQRGVRNQRGSSSAMKHPALSQCVRQLKHYSGAVKKGQHCPEHHCTAHCLC